MSVLVWTSACVCVCMYVCAMCACLLVGLCVCLRLFLSLQCYRVSTFIFILLSSVSCFLQLSVFPINSPLYPLFPLIHSSLLFHLQSVNSSFLFTSNSSFLSSALPILHCQMSSSRAISYPFLCSSSTSRFSYL